MQRIERLTKLLRNLFLAAAAMLVLAGLAWLVERSASPLGLALLASSTVVLLLLYRGVHRHLPGRLLLRIDLDNGVVEHVPDSPLGLLGGSKPVLHDVVEALDRAAEDARVLAVILRLGTSGMGLAQAEEIREVLLRLRSSRTRTVAVAETFGEAGNGTVDYYVATACDQIVLQRLGEFGAIGFLSRAPFFRGALDRLSITPRFDHRREYKSAMYLFTEESVPPPQREATEAVLSSSLDAVVSAVASSRGLDPADVAAAIDDGPLLPREAFVRGLVDRLAFQDEVEHELETDLGARTVDLPTYRVRARPRRRGATVAVVHVAGAIVRGRSRPSPFGRGMAVGSDDIREALDAAASAKRVCAVVMRVDSPGGSAVGSEAIWRAVQRVREGGKPVVVSMGNVAGSGGYYVACGADRIVAQPGTITGSIGVVSGKLLTARAWERIGVRWGELTAGEHADMWSSQSDFSDGQWQRFQRYLDEVYEGFKQRVADGRGLSPTAVEEVAKGRIWSGTDAHDRGLVDELGGLDRAVEAAKSLAGIASGTPVALRVMPERSKLPWRRIRRRTAAAVDAWQDTAALRTGVATMLEHLAPPGVLWWDGDLR